MSPARRTHPRRLEAWLWSGPVGHLVGGTLDFLQASARYARFRVHARRVHTQRGGRTLRRRRGFLCRGVLRRRGVS